MAIALLADVIPFDPRPESPFFLAGLSVAAIGVLAAVAYVIYAFVLRKKPGKDK